MLNLFITPKCSLKCDYCFVADDFGGAPFDLTKTRFLELLAWLLSTKTQVVALLGGEPTLHPELFYFLNALYDQGVCPVVFTNGLFPKSYAEPLAKLTYRLVVNYNPPEVYRPGDLERRDQNLGLLSDFGAKMAFSKNFAPSRLAYGYLIEGARRYGVTTIRYDLSRPKEGGRNDHFAGAAIRRAAGLLTQFVKDAKKAGLTVGLDCCLPYCFFAPEDLAFLKEASEPFNGTCRPSLDILPDLSVIHCWPLKNLKVTSALEHDGELGLLERFATEALVYRQMRRSLCPASCQTPPSVCQGGCLAEAEAAFEVSPEDFLAHVS
ncbi:MAG: radical SAM protein [Deltaproteobacteria bacterium]|nr:radical SAM protein [Deltaproteobacteria bacterium]